MKLGIYLGYEVKKNTKDSIKFEEKFYIIENKNKTYKSFEEARKNRGTKNAQNCWIISIDDEGSITYVENAFK